MADARRAVGWLTRPAVVFSALGVTVLIAVLLTPQGSSSGDQRLTTYSAGPYGARGLYDVARRLGWRAQRLETPLSARPRTDVIYAVLAPRRPLTPAETHRMLDAVRAGAALLVVAERRSPLADSLGLRISVNGGVVQPPLRPACPRGSAQARLINWYDGRIHSLWLTPTRPLDGERVTFVSVRHAPVRQAAARPKARGEDDESDDDETEVRGDSVTAPAALGFSLGRGRVVAIADPDLLRNDVIRVCRWGSGLAAVRMLAWLGDGRPPGEAGTLVFDEYHQGFQIGGGGATTVWRAAWSAPAGRTVLHGTAAALVLLLALGPRALAPRSRARVQRRSALEHVGALARAYEQVDATRTATRLLARGLLRRHRLPDASSGGSGLGRDSEFLARVTVRHPTLAPDVQRIRAAMEDRVSANELLEVGHSVVRIDDTLRQ